MSLAKYLIFCYLGVACCLSTRASEDDLGGYGPAYDRFKLTLAPGWRKEAVGPLFYSEQNESQHSWGIPPLGFVHLQDPDTESEEYDFIYPLLTYDRYGAESRWEFFQLLSFANGKNEGDTNTHRFTLFPIYFQQRSTDVSSNYTALVPIYGTLKHRLFRDEVHFVMLPLYVKSRKKDVETWNMPWPFFHLREGDELSGWQFWPFYGRERKGVTAETNGWGELRIIGGHDNQFIVWPFYTDNIDGIGTDMPTRQQGYLPFYSSYRSDLRDSSVYFWPLGVTHTIEREKNYEEWDAPWPLIEFARGPGKTTSRVFPFFSESKNPDLENNWYLWPIYKVNRITAPPLYHSRTRIAFFLYQAFIERNTETGDEKRRNDFLPFYTWEKDFNGNQRLQVLSVIEPFFPTSKSIRRDYSPLFALWRAEENPKNGASSRSLLWNLYRRDSTPDTKKISLLFGLYRYQSGPEGTRWRAGYVFAGGTAKRGADRTSPP